MSGEDIYFLYASQTGNAETIAKQVHHQASHGPDAPYPSSKCMCLNDFERLQLLVDQPPPSAGALQVTHTLIIVCSTTGDGEIPENGAKFKRWLRNSTVSLATTRFTVLALGDTNYNAFCLAGKYCDTKLEEKGARRFYARGEADDAFGLDSVVDPWIIGLWDALKSDGSTATRQTFHADGEVPVIPLDVALETLLLYDTSDSLVQHTAMFILERVFEFGGKCSVLPISAVNEATLSAKNPQVLVFLCSGASTYTSPSAIGGLSVSALATWLQTLSRVVSYGFLGVVPPLFAGERQHEAAVMLRGLESAISHVMQSCKRCQVLDLCAQRQQQPAASLPPLHLLAGTCVVSTVDAVLLWTHLLLDRLPGVVANASQIASSINRHSDWFSAHVSASSQDVSRKREAIREGGAGKSSLLRPEDLVHSVLTQLVFLYAGDSQTIAAIAHDIQAQAQPRGLDSTIVDIANYKSVGFPRRAFFVFIVGSSPSGLPKSLVKMLKMLKALERDGQSLSAVKFAILGIDDRHTTLSSFNAGALELECVLLGMSAAKCHPTGLADSADEQWLQDVLVPWSGSLWSSIAAPVSSQAYLDSGASGQPSTLETSELSPDATVAENTTTPQLIAGASWFPWEQLKSRPEAAASTPVTLLYSGSGMAKAIALQAMKEGQEMGFPMSMMSFGKAAIHAGDVLRRKCIVCFVESANDGVRLASGGKFKKYLSSMSQSPDVLSHLHFAVLALGESTAHHPAHSVAKRLSALQGNRVFPVCFVSRLSQLHTVGIPWFRGVVAAMSNLVGTNRSGFTPNASPSLGPAQPSTLLDAPSLSLSAVALKGPQLLFLYGSVTGNAENIARDLHREALERGCASRVSSLDKFERMQFLSHDVVIIVCCTTCSPLGEGGAFPLNAQRFARYLFRKQHPDDLLAPLRYAVLALGSSRYQDTYCSAGKAIDARLSQLGATRVCDLGLADEAQGLEVAVEAWRAALFLTVCADDARRGGSAESTPSLRPARPPTLSLVVPPTGAEASPAVLEAPLPMQPHAAQTSVLVMYGSQKGNAEAVARHIYQQMIDRQEPYEFDVCCMNDFEAKHWRKFTFVIFVCSTTGDGEFPDNAIMLYRFLRQKDHPEDLLAGMKYAVLGLGDTNYSRFCLAARTLDRRLEEVGASRFYARGEADDAFGLESVVEPWIDNLWSALQRAAVLAGQRASALSGGLAAIDGPLNVSKVGVSPVKGASGSDHLAKKNGAGDVSETGSSTSHRLLQRSKGGVADRTVVAKISNWRRMTPDCSDNNVVLLDFEVPESTSWQPGDAIAILPSNNADEVESILNLLKTNGDDIFLPPTASGVTSLFPTSPIYDRISYPITNREVLMHLVSLRIHRAGKQIFSVFLLNTQDPAEQAMLSSWMPSASGTAPGGGGVTDTRLTLLDLLRKFEKCRPPFRHVVEYLMVLQPRPYSICSAQILSPKTLSICFKVVPNGLCTNWLLQRCEAFKELSRQRAEAGELHPMPCVEIPITFREAPEFRVPQDLHVPLILIGPGTGVAPFIAFLQHREGMARRSGIKPGEVQLFFGCRTNANDYIFREELSAFVADKTLTTLHVAFSQEPNAGFFWYGGCYVQDKMQECSQCLCELVVHRNAHVYVCGDAESMARDVHRVLIDIIEQHQQWSTAEATQFVQRMAEEGRYQRDIWTSSQ